MNKTAMRRLAAMLLNQDLDAWVEARRSEGDGWDRIATELAMATEGGVVVSGQTLRRWYAPEANGGDAA